MKLQAGRWYEDREDRVHGPVLKLPKEDHRYEGEMRFVCGKLTWGKRGNYWYDGHKHSCDLIREVPAPSECRVVDHRYPGGVAPARPVDEDMQHRDFHKEGARLVRSVSSPEGDKDLIARLLDAAQLTPVGQIGDDSLTWCQKQFYAEKAVNDWAAWQKRFDVSSAQAMPEPARVAPPLVPKAIKRKKWGDWIEGPVDVWWNGRKVQAEVVPAILGAQVIRHRIKNPRE